MGCGRVGALTLLGGRDREGEANNRAGEGMQEAERCSEGVGNNQGYL